MLTPEECKELRASHLGPLFKIGFYRLILDEAHEIKNHESQRRMIFEFNGSACGREHWR